MADPDDHRTDEDARSSTWSMPFHDRDRTEEQPDEAARPDEPVASAPDEVTAAATPLARTAGDEPADEPAAEAADAVADEPALPAPALHHPVREDPAPDAAAPPSRAWEDPVEDGPAADDPVLDAAADDPVLDAAAAGDAREVPSDGPEVAESAPIPPAVGRDGSKGTRSPGDGLLSLRAGSRYVLALLLVAGALIVATLDVPRLLKAGVIGGMIGAAFMLVAPNALQPSERGVGLRRVLDNAALAWFVAGVAILGLVAMAAAGLPALRAESERAEVRERGEIVALRVTTFEGQTIEEWVAETRALATGEYAQQLDDVFDQELRDALRENEVESVGTIQRSFVQSLEGDRAEVFVLARQTSVNAQRADPVEDELRIEIGLQRVGGEWLASDIAVLGPQQAAPVPDPDGQVEPEEAEDQ